MSSFFWRLPCPIPPDTKLAKKGYFWDESTSQWMHSEYLGWLLLAGMAGVPGNCKRLFARYVAWTADGSFIERDRSKPNWCKLISVMSCGEGY